MEAFLLKEGTEVSDIDKTVKIKWRWAGLIKTGDNGEPFGSVQRDEHVFVWFAIKIVHGSNVKKVLSIVVTIM